jgi:hypothetical protein
LDDGFYDEQPVLQRAGLVFGPLPVVYGPAMIEPMGASFDGGGSGAADAPREWRSERKDTPERDDHAMNCRYLQDIQEEPAGDAEVLATDAPVRVAAAGAAARDGEPEGEEITDQSADLQAEVHSEDQNPLFEIERRSITDSVKAFVEFGKRRLLSLAADHVLPVVGGRLVDWAFGILDVVASVRALGSDEPVLEAPLPSPVPGLDFTLEIPLTSGEDGQTAPRLAFCTSPDSPSPTGGWAMDAAEGDDPQAQQPPADAPGAALERLYAQREPVARPIETGQAGQPGPRVRRRSATACLVEIDLDSLRLPRDRKLRAWVLAFLAAEHASRLRDNPGLGRFEVFIIADKGRRCGLWIWLDAGLEIDHLVL